MLKSYWVNEKKHRGKQSKHKTISDFLLNDDHTRRVLLYNSWTEMLHITGTRETVKKSCKVIVDFRED